MSNDGFLYTGLTSASSEPKTPRELQKQSKEQARQKLKPASEVVLNLIKIERDAVTDIRTFILDNTTAEKEVNTELIARRRYISYLNGLEAKILNITSDKKKKGRDE